jgi:hypothetical protein
MCVETRCIGISLPRTVCHTDGAHGMAEAVKKIQFLLCRQESVLVCISMNKWGILGVGWFGSVLFTLFFCQILSIEG